jgi:hypothetical protein
MRRGAWHQCCDKSQRLVHEELQHGIGVGVIISPRDVSMPNAVQYSQMYHEAGAHVLIDQQFYTPHFSNRLLQSYPISQYRTSVSALHQITDPDLAAFASSLRDINAALATDGLIAPAVVYEAARSDIVQLNARLFAAAKQAGDELGIPTYATVVLGRSVTSSNATVDTILSQVTALNSDGWYYGFEFEPERIPSSYAAVLRCCAAGLTLACTGKPVLHAYAGPMGLLSLGFGATGAGIGHYQNVWKFTGGRWRSSAVQGGGGNAPPRYFSAALWGTIVYPDEVVRLNPTLQGQVLTQSPFSPSGAPGRSGPWSRWDAHKHLVYVICRTLQDISADEDPRRNTQAAVRILQGSTVLHGAIAGSGVMLGDGTNVYQHNWATALNELLNSYSRDFDYLELLT